MATAIGNMYRLARAGIVLGRHGVQFIPHDPSAPLPLRVARKLMLPLGWLSGSAKDDNRHERISKAVAKLGPSYIKLGQTLATRRDVIPAELAEDLAKLQDKMPAFSMEEAKATILEQFGVPVEELFEEFGEPVAAASIAQVHKGSVRLANGELKQVAVKILRPSIERQFKRDLDSYFFAARVIERLHEPSRRLRPVAVVKTLEDSMDIELDLRLEAAAISEMSDNVAADEGFRVPSVDWKRTSQRVLTIDWVDGIGLNDLEAVRAAGHDMKSLGETVIQSFLKHALRDGFFHADMHQGNLFVAPDGAIVAVDFGIMGRCGPRECRFLAEILYGFITRDYKRIAQVHFEAGYVPEDQSIDMFAQALRAVGEPVMDRPASEISMAQLLGQLFQYTEVFEMKTRTELIMLQKTMVIVEGVARSLHPDINMYTAAEPVVKEWIESQLGLSGQLGNVRDGAQNVGRILGDLPSLITRAERTAGALSEMAQDGLRLDDETIKQIAREQSRSEWWLKAGIWIGALSLAALVTLQLFGGRT